MDPKDKPLAEGSDGADKVYMQPRMVKSEDLLQESSELLILHRGELYRLRETRNGKLLLIK